MSAVQVKATKSEREQCIDSLAARYFEHRYPGHHWPRDAETKGKAEMYRRRAEQWLRTWGLLDALEETVQ